jgi:hypothetical protein
MKTNRIELVMCNVCDAKFPSEDLVSTTHCDHGIGDWFCPHCGGGDYDGVNEDGSIDTEFW